MIKIFIDDDVKSFTREFGEIIKTKNIHFRRYSLLTVLYLYNCKKILRKYEKSLVSKYGNEILDLGYNFRIDRMFSITFKHQALMWETEEKVYPIEVLLLLGMYKKAIKYQKKLKEYLDEEKINKIIKIINEPNLILVGKKLIVFNGEDNLIVFQQICKIFKEYLGQAAILCTYAEAIIVCLPRNFDFFHIISP